MAELDLRSDVGEKILVVDDDPGIRDLISEFLARHGYTVESAADAVEMGRVMDRRRPAGGN